MRAALRDGERNDSREGALRYTLLATTYVRQDDPDLDHAVYLADHVSCLLTEQVAATRCTAT
ncbi:hypothetical protein ABIA39_008643 [Nocardia sp. GAS34]|uniref:hypothetical protein n=1 Tax=unclassified Nocardia TaxID=2637762 RepID=UPI003D1F5791